MSYKPIENYGIIGDLHTVALVGTDGSIDWYCMPSFDSPSVFATILDDQKGGYFKISALRESVQKQLYFPETNVLITRFSNPDGVAQITDFMPMSSTSALLVESHVSIIVRQVTAVRGSVGMRLECFPAFNYGRTAHKVVPVPGAVVFESATGERLALTIPDGCPVREDGVVYDFTLEPGQTVSFVLRNLHSYETEPSFSFEGEITALFESTVDFWHRWLNRSRYSGRWQEMIDRSLLTLKLLTYAPTGAIVAAATTSLPEEISGVRNWDYRYTWIRDAAFTLYGFMRVGLTEEAERFMQWLESCIHDLTEDGGLNIMYTINGNHVPAEEILSHLDGYKGSRPVRIGNAAQHQLQLDIYGALMDSVYLYNKYGSPISYDFWVHLRHMLNWLCDHWREPDEGIWEVRGGRQHFVYSKLMCWVALDRGLRLADKRSFPADRERWLKERDAIYEDIQLRGWNPQRGAFVQHYGSSSLDAATLFMPLTFFMSPTDPRMVSTIDAITKELTNDSLVHRYNVDTAARDGLIGAEGTFSMCTFWLVEALTRSGRLAEARFLFERMLGYANHLGLYAEEVGPTGEALGNFPQAFTHLALISAAYNLDRTLGRRG